MPKTEETVETPNTEGMDSTEGESGDLGEEKSTSAPAKKSYAKRAYDALPDVSGRLSDLCHFLKTTWLGKDKARSYGDYLPSKKFVAGVATVVFAAVALNARFRDNNVARLTNNMTSGLKDMIFGAKEAISDAKSESSFMER